MMPLRQRIDVIEGLDALSTLDDDSPDWPDLTNAIHWVVDDTAWDLRPLEFGHGEILISASEVEAVQGVLTPLLSVLDELGALGADSDYFAHARWPEVRERSAAAAALLRAFPVDWSAHP